MEAGINAWGTSWGDSWGTAWGTQQVILVDTHDGADRKHDAEISEAKDRLKSQLETAFESAFQKRPSKQNVAPKVETVEFDDEDDWLILL